MIALPQREDFSTEEEYQSAVESTNRLIKEHFIRLARIPEEEKKKKLKELGFNYD